MNLPVVVTGASRSGKSLISSLLNTSGEFALVREPRVLWNAGNPQRRDDRLGPGDVDEEEAARIREGCVRLAGERRYLDDLAYHALQIPLVRAVFPDVRIVHVVRDYRAAIPEAMVFWKARPPLLETLRKTGGARKGGLDLPRLFEFGRQFVANYWDVATGGARRTCGPRVPGMDELPAETPLAAVVAWQWANLVRIAREDLAGVPSGQWLEVRFEDVLREPARALETVARRVEVRDVGAVVEAAGRVVATDGLAAERESLTAEDWMAVERIVGDVLGDDGRTAIA